MFIQKVFHIRQSLEESKALLTSADLLGCEIDGIKKAGVIADGIAELECELPSGFQTRCVISELPTENPNQALFQSTGGNMEICGLIEFIPVRDQLTEVQLTLDYSFQSTIHGLIDRMTHDSEEFLNRVLERVVTWVNHAAWSLARPDSVRRGGGLLQLAQ